MPVPLSKLPGHFTQAGKFVRHVRVAKLIQVNDGRIVKFRDLPDEAQLALIQYMAIDGEAWDVPPALKTAIDAFLSRFPSENRRQQPEAVVAWETSLRRFLSYYGTQYGNQEFGYVPAIPMSDLIASVMQDHDLAQDWAAQDGWKGYHDWYMNHAGGPKHTAPSGKQWPVILAGFDTETLEDGWTRFHQYAERKLATTPALFFPPHRKRKSKVA